MIEMNRERELPGYVKKLKRYPLFYISYMFSKFNFWSTCKTCFLQLFMSQWITCLMNLSFITFCFLACANWVKLKKKEEGGGGREWSEPCFRFPFGWAEFLNYPMKYTDLTFKQPRSHFIDCVWLLRTPFPSPCYHHPPLIVEQLAHVAWKRPLIWLWSLLSNFYYYYLATHFFYFTFFFIFPLLPFFFYFYFFFYRS